MDDTTLENLYELDFKGITKKLAGYGANQLDQIKLGAKASLGAMFGHGSADVNENTRVLLQAWIQFCQQKGTDSRSPTVEEVADFLKNRVGAPQYAKLVMAKAAKAAPKSKGSPAPSAPAEPSDEVKADMERLRSMGNPRERASAEASAAQSKAFNVIMGELKKSAPNRNAVYKLTQEIIAHAKKAQGPEKTRAMAFLKHLKKPENLSKVPNLANLTLETAQQIVDLAMILVEAEEPARQALWEGYDRLAEATAMSFADLKTLFGEIARDFVVRSNNASGNRSTRPASGSGSEGGSSSPATPAATGAAPSAAPAASANNAPNQVNYQTRVNTLDLYADLQRVNGMSDHSKFVAVQQACREDTDKGAAELRNMFGGEQALSKALAIYINHFTKHAI